MMYYESPDGLAQWAEVAMIGKELVGAGVNYLTGQKTGAVLDKQLKAQQKALQTQQEMQTQQLRAMQKAQEATQQMVSQEQAYQEAAKRRQEQVIALYGVGGVAVVIAGIFLISALRKNGKAAKGAKK